MVPKINFKWSFIYQEEIHLPNKISYSQDKAENYINNFTKKLSKEWNKKGKNILRYMENLTNVKWNKKEIGCYIIKISKFGPISDPLTIPIQLKCGKQIFTLNTNRFIDIMTHELIHNLFIQSNNKKIDKYLAYLIKKKYKGFGWNTAIHVPVHAIHKEILLKFFNEKRLKDEIKMSSYHSEYKKSWGIVEKEGSRNIINELRKFISANN